MSQRVHFITYADYKYERSMQTLILEAKQFNEFSSVTGFRPSNLSPSFVRNFLSILKLPRGAGYWIWKFDIIRQALDKMDDNDILIYLDAGCSINVNAKKRYNEYIDMLNKSEYGFFSFSFRDYFKECFFTTKEILQYFDETPESDLGQDYHLMAGILLMKKCSHTYKILDKCMELLNYDPKLITDYYNKNNQSQDFRDNRHDQSILSVVRNKYGSCIIDDETYTNGDWRELSNIPFLSRRRKL